MAFRCASPICPGFPWPASEHPHPCAASGVPGEPGSPERAAYVDAPARFARENPGVLDALAAAGFRGGQPFPEPAGHPGSDVDPAAEERRDAEMGRNLIWCPVCQTAHLPKKHETVGSFPPEPAFGSPEAVERAADAIARLEPENARAIRQIYPALALLAKCEPYCPVQIQDEIRALLAKAGR